MLVAAPGDEDPDRGAVKLSPPRVVDDGDVEPELAGEGGLEFACFQLDDDVPELLGVEEEQIDEEVVTGDVEVRLAVDERKARPELAEGVNDPVEESLLKVTVRHLAREPEEVEPVRVFGELSGEVRVCRGELAGEV